MVRQQVFTDYDKYLQSNWWYSLKEKYIYSKKDASCFLCKKTSTLLLHHVSYKNLYHEKLKRDVFILCYKCHSEAHFYKVFFFFTRKVLMDERSLRKRLYFLKSKYVAQQGNIVLSVWYFLCYTFVFPYFFV